MKLSVWLCIVAVGGVTWMAASAPARISGDAADVPGLTLPALTGCTADAWGSAWTPEVKGATSEVRATYRCGDLRVHVYVGQFAHQASEAEALSEVQRIIPAIWRVHSTSVAARLADGFEANEHRLNVQGTELRILSWYAVDDRPYRSRWVAKLAEVVDAVRLRSPPVALLAVAIDGNAERAAFVRQGNDVWKWYLEQLEQQREVST